MTNTPAAYRTSLIDSPRMAEFEPEEKLWAAVLFQAIEDAHLDNTRENGKPIRDMKKCKANKLHRARAIAWFNSKSYYVGSFLWICAYFDLTPEIIRDIVLAKDFKKTLSMQWMETREE